MLQWDCELLNAGQVQRFRLREGETALRCLDVIERWQADSAFRQFFNKTLADASFSAYRWELPAMWTDSVERPFEFVLLNCPELERPPDRHAFAEHFTTGSSVVEFANLGKDAHLIVPCPLGPESAYVHLAAFVRQAPPDQCDELWRLVGQTVQAQLGQRKWWLSTAGMGVAWLHVRLDSRPKYYGFHPYTAGR